MNDKINNALLELQQSLEEIHHWTELIRNSEKAASGAIEGAATVLDSAEHLLERVSKDTEETWRVLQEIAIGNQRNVQLLLDEYQELSEATRKLVEYLRSVNFPSRLDKIDASISAITLGVNNLSDKLDRYRDQGLSKMEEEHLQNRNIISSLQEQLKRAQRRQNLYFGLLIATQILVGAAFAVYLLTKG